MRNCSTAVISPGVCTTAPNPNTLDFTLVADLGWRFTKDANSKPTLAGNHGYDNRYKQMQAIFYAMGPAFKVHYRMPSFESVCVFPLILDLFHLKGPKTDEDIQLVRRMLRQP